MMRAPYGALGQQWHLELLGLGGPFFGSVKAVVVATRFRAVISRERSSPWEEIRAWQRLLNSGAGRGGWSGGALGMSSWITAQGCERDEIPCKPSRRSHQPPAGSLRSMAAPSIPHLPTHARTQLSKHPQCKRPVAHHLCDAAHGLAADAWATNALTAEGLSRAAPS